MSSNKQHTIKAPNVFRFIEPNINTCVLFLNSLMNSYYTAINIDFSEVSEMEYSDYMMLVAQIEKAKIQNATKFYRVGKPPLSQKVNNILKGKKNVKHLNIVVDNLEAARKARDLNPFVIKEVVEDLNKIGITDFFDKFEILLSEMVGNATEHGVKESKINWWLMDDLISDSQRVNFTFLDMGIGIIGSHKKAGLPWKYRFLPYTIIPKHSLYGKLRSSTKKDNRGQGLQQIRKYIVEGVVENFLLVTNCVSLRYQDGQFRTSRIQDFEGTYFSWSISKESYNKWKSTQ